MNRSVSALCLAVTIACVVSVGAVSQQPDLGQKEALLADAAVVGGSLNVSAQLPFGKKFETSLVVVFTYTYPRGNTVRVLFGPNEGDNEPAEGWILSNGDFHLERGFAYMNYTGSSATTSATGGATTQPANSRPYIRTKRVNAVGEGSDWAVQVGDNYDRIFFVDGTKVVCESEIVAAFKYTLDEGGKKSFTQIPDHNGTTSVNPFTTEEFYVNSSGANAFVVYVDTFYPLYGMKKMQ